MDFPHSKCSPVVWRLSMTLASMAARTFHSASVSGNGRDQGQKSACVQRCQGSSHSGGDLQI